MKLPLVGAAPPPRAERPRCPWCIRPLRPDVRTVYERTAFPDGVGFYQKPVAREWRGAYQGYGAFCSLVCCAAYANAIYEGRRAAP